MRQSFVLVIAFGMLLAACNNDKIVKHTEKNEDGTTTTTTVDTKNIATTTDEMNKKMEELKKLTPLSIDQLKALLPENLNGFPRTNFNANSSMGFAIAEGEYQKDDSTELKLVIYDCAGEAGAGIYGLNYWTKMNMQSENTNGYTKTTDFMGGKAVETYDKGSNEYTLTYTTNNRLLVVMSGRNVGIDVIKKNAEALNLKV